MKRVILSAFNVHVGGGLVLLKSLILSKYIKINILDLRVKKKIKDLKLLNALYIKRKIFSRLFWFHLVSWKSKKMM